MYLVGMDHKVREEITATTAAHRELGPGYDDAVAEGLVERIGAEIDRRVDARLAQRGLGGQVSPPARSPSVSAIVLALGSMAIGGITAAGLLNTHNGGGPAVVAALIWIIIGIINVAYNRRR
jgi:hypothetical protein